MRHTRTARNDPLPLRRGNPKNSPQSTAFRVGRVRAVLRGRVWYLNYSEHGRRRQPRVGPDKREARNVAAEINAQLCCGAPTSFGYEPISIPDLRELWLSQHEHVRRSSLNTICRYRAATKYLVRFATEVRPLRHVSDLQPRIIEEFVRYLRIEKTAPNGHRNSRKRRLRDSGVRFILMTCSSLLNYARRHRHLPPYVENPFRAIEISRIPVEDSRPIGILTSEHEKKLLLACNDHQFPILLTLMLTGLRPGELAHLLLPGDLDLENGWLHIRNKARLGWQVKTRTERSIPLGPVLVDVLRYSLRGRTVGPVFWRQEFKAGQEPTLSQLSQEQIIEVLERRLAEMELDHCDVASREIRNEVCTSIWRDLGAFRSDKLAPMFIALNKSIGHPEFTAPKTLRHTFATSLQDANVDPLIRNELMGHAPGGLGMTGVYTHTRPETKRQQLLAAEENRTCVQVAKQWLAVRSNQVSVPTVSEEPSDG